MKSRITNVLDEYDKIGKLGVIGVLMTNSDIFRGNVSLLRRGDRRLYRERDNVTGCQAGPGEGPGGARGEAGQGHLQR